MKAYFEKWTKREEVYDLSIGGTAKKARFQSNLITRKQPEPEQRSDDNTISSVDASHEYINNASAAAMVKEQRMQVMAEDVGRKDNQLAAMLTKMHAKDKQMTELIMQVAAMKTGGHYTGNDNDDKSQGTRNSKRKAVDSVTGGGGGIGEGGARIKMRTVRGGWTHHSKFSFPVDQNAPFIAREIKWDSSWPAYKQAYHNARKAIQDAEAAKERAEKREPTKAIKIAALKKQLEDLE